MANAFSKTSSPSHNTTDESAFIFPAKLLSSHIRVNEEVEQRVCEQAAEGLRARAPCDKSVFYG